MPSSVKILLMAGGKGTRLWPKSRRILPKQFMPIKGQKTLFQQTVDRISTLVDMDQLYVVTTPEYVHYVNEQVPALHVDQIIVEPCQHSTTASLAYILLWSHVRQMSLDDIVVILPTDAYVNESASFAQCLRDAVELARDTDGVVTIGVPPSYPATRYGYIQAQKRPVGRGLRVSQFVEKPDLETARQYVLDKDIFWNSGIFIWKLSTLQSLFQVHLPKDHQKISEMVARWRELDHDNLVHWYVHLSKQPFEYTIIENTSNIYMVPATFEWTDLGTWSSLIETLSTRAGHNDVPVVMHEAHGCLVENEHGLVALFGVDDLIVVHTKDALLICSRNREEHIKRLLDVLSQQQYDDYL